jgi:hypothetical protein
MISHCRHEREPDHDRGAADHRHTYFPSLIRGQFTSLLLPRQIRFLTRPFAEIAENLLHIGMIEQIREIVHDPSDFPDVTGSVSTVHRSQ